MQLERTKHDCRTTKDDNGYYSHAFVYSDAMTASKGSTPVKGKKGRRSNPPKQLENRLFAIEVILGDIDLLVYASVDDTISGGANLGVEITRLGLEYLKMVICLY